jgi:hypothetical protein
VPELEEKLRWTEQTKETINKSLETVIFACIVDRRARLLIWFLPIQVWAAKSDMDEQLKEAQAALAASLDKQRSANLCVCSQFEFVRF